ncbi:DsrE family protein [Acidithiobacillus sp. M4-SHS-6]|uniref:DsrE family protein n=1 Tax=Acidithiobacillus sp. M4-SHS-6 TaxID=3383024 RepID=UPI0039BE1DAC
MHWTILLKSDPEAKGNPILHGLRIAASALADDVKISIFLTQEAISLAFRDEQAGAKQKAQQDLLHELQELGARTYVVGLEWLHQAEKSLLNTHIEAASMKTLVRQMKISDQVITL